MNFWKFKAALLLIAASLVAIAAVRAEDLKPAEGAAGAPISHRIMICEYGEKNRIAEVSPEGKIVWEYPPPSICVIFQPLENSHVLMGLGGKPTGVREVD